MEPSSPIPPTAPSRPTWRRWLPSVIAAAVGALALLGAGQLYASVGGT